MGWVGKISESGFQAQPITQSIYFWRKAAARGGRFNPPVSRVFLHLRMSNVGGGKITPRCISSSVAPRKKIPTAIPMFSRSSVSMMQTVMSPEVGM